jgi:hypothetical protein
MTHEKCTDFLRKRFSKSSFYKACNNVMETVTVIYRFIINVCPIAVGVDGVVECAASLITWMRLVAVIEICLLVCLTL